MSMAIKIDRVEIYNEELLSIKLPDPFYFSSCCVTATTKPMVTKYSQVVTYYKKIQSIRSHKPLSTWSRYKFLKNYLHYHNTYGY